MGDRPKLLVHSNCPWAPTGYGQQVGLFAPPLAEHYDLSISSYYGLEGAPINWRGIPILPGLGPEFGNEFLIPHARFHFGGNERGGLVMTLMDVWVLRPDIVSQLNACCWVPVDHEPAPPAVRHFFAESGAIPIAMSRFGEEQLAEFDPLYVPHGVDTGSFKPRPKDQSREAVGLDKDAFVVGMVAANKGRPSRKCFQQAFEAFAALHQKHENAHLYLHTVLNPNHAAGEDLPAILAALGVPDEAVTVSSQYRMGYMPWTHEEMSYIYSSMDVLMNPAAGEGFGVPILEAQACGVPTVVTNFSAMKEVCGAGWKVAARPQWTPQGSWQVTPDVGEIYTALEKCRGLTRTERESLAKKARRHALTYSVPKVMEEHFLPALAEAQERIGEQPLVAA